MTSKATRQIELHKNSICKWVQDKTLTAWHIFGRINPAGIFTKEMRDGAHSHRLWDSFMSCLSDFYVTPSLPFTMPLNILLTQSVQRLLVVAPLAVHQAISQPAHLCLSFVLSHIYIPLVQCGMISPLPYSWICSF